MVRIRGRESLCEAPFRPFRQRLPPPFRTMLNFDGISTHRLRGVNGLNGFHDRKGSFEEQFEGKLTDRMEYANRGDYDDIPFSDRQNLLLRIFRNGRSDKSPVVDEATSPTSQDSLPRPLQEKSTTTKRRSCSATSPRTSR